MASNDLKMSIKEIRDKIDINCESWKYIKETNCYAYALGLDIPCDLINDHAYEPGTISNTNKFYEDELWHLNYNRFMYCLYSDLYNLGIEFKEVAPTTKIECNEWKIALYTEFLSYPGETILDFHFLRESKEGLWYHKIGWEDGPTNIDINNKIITNLDNCFLGDYEYQKCLCLKLKKE